MGRVIPRHVKPAVAPRIFNFACREHKRRQTPSPTLLLPLADTTKYAPSRVGHLRTSLYHRETYLHCRNIALARLADQQSTVFAGVHRCEAL